MWQKIYMIRLQDSMEWREKLHDNETTTQHLVPCTIMADNTVENKTSSLLLNVIPDNWINYTIINWKLLHKVFVPNINSKPIQFQMIMGIFDFWYNV